MKSLITFLTIAIILSTAVCLSCSKENPQVNPPVYNPPDPPPDPVISIPCGSRAEINLTLIPVGRLSSARAGIQCAHADGKILFFGGWHDGQNSWNEPVPVDIFTISDNTWSTHLLVPENSQFTHFRTGAAVAAVGHKILFAGGGDPIGDIQTSRVDIYDASTNRWSYTNLSAARFMLVASTVGDQVLFAGGYGYPDGWTWGAFNTVDIYNNSTNTWSVATLSEARSYLSATTAGDKIYFAGGRTGEQSSKTIDIYDAVSNTWSVAALKYARAGIAGIATDDRIFWAGGGYSRSGVWYNYNSVEILDLITGDITLECMSSQSVYKAVKKGDNLIFFAENTSNSGNQIEIYNIPEGVWYTGKLNDTIDGGAIIAVNNEVYVAGGKVNGMYSDQVWKLEF